MNKTPCEKLGYKVGDKFVVIRTNETAASRAGDIIKLTSDDGSLQPGFKIVGSGVACWPSLDDIAKIDSDGWIEWKGGEMPVERGTLVDVKYRDGKETVGVTAGIYDDDINFKKKGGCNRCATYWFRHWHPDAKAAEIVAYRLHHEEGTTVDEPDCQLKPYPTLDDLMHAWQKAKAKADTSRNILKLAEQDEADARKALDDALRAAGWGDAQQDEPLNITDWRDLKVGDIIWWSGDENFHSGEYTVDFHEGRGYCGDYPFAIRNEYGAGEWVDVDKEQFCFIRRPA
ncbi:hypothetical protein F8538_06245 [Edwardsiella ictaluri]|uniref:hypothetical protein n=1 Tax=Edwardsiella ictaluri TaxID=67780 RepID=UPI0018DCAFE7|nr:hypothetical protein [Edwardsiella ictaluri]QPW25404.1 hypothetical protein F8538_06245 [Edwardsiella ictaluri]